MSKRETHFADGGEAYANFRPTYPESLAKALAEAAPSRGLAIDVGCGTGQLSALLADQFDAVVASDISADQIANATPHDRIAYHVAPAHQIPVEDASAHLITVAQAAHWLDLDPFYGEVCRVAAPGAVLALITYGVMNVEGPLADRFNHFYWEELKGHWPPERRHVENGYANLAFPFEPIELPELSIERTWSLEPFLGYLTTWSAVKAARKNGAGDTVDSFEADARSLWGDPSTVYDIAWPLSLRLGRVQ